MAFPDTDLPDPATWYAGVMIGHPLIKANIIDPLNTLGALLGNQIRMQARRAAVLSVPDQSGPPETYFPVPLDHLDSTSTPGLVLTVDGRYQITEADDYDLFGTVGFTANATGVRGGSITLNGAGIDGTFSLIPACTGGYSTRVPLPPITLGLDVGNIIGLDATQTCGGPLNTSIAGPPRLTVRRVQG